MGPLLIDQPSVLVLVAADQLLLGAAAGETAQTVSGLTLVRAPVRAAVNHRSRRPRRFVPLPWLSRQAHTSGRAGDQR